LGCTKQSLSTATTASMTVVVTGALTDGVLQFGPDVANEQGSGVPKGIFGFYGNLQGLDDSVELGAPCLLPNPSFIPFHPSLPGIFHLPPAFLSRSQSNARSPNLPSTSRLFPSKHRRCHTTSPYGSTVHARTMATRTPRGQSWPATASLHPATPIAERGGSLSPSAPLAG